MATAYGTIADADLYFTERGGVDAFPAWFGATELQKQTAHILGTEYLDLEYEPRMQGWRAVEGQSNAYPREGVVVEGYCLSSTEVPLRAKQASWEAALRHLQGESLLPDSIDRSAGGEIESESKAAGSVKKSVTYREGTQTNVRTFRRIDALMSPLLVGGTGGVPVRFAL